MLLAAWLIALQAFLAGVAAAQAAVMPADPFGVICSGAGANVDLPDAGAPTSADLRHLCCSACLAQAPALIAPSAPPQLANYPRRADPLALAAPPVIVLPTGAIRAGPSQAPPFPA
jgi:hypothetical protein